MTAQTFTVIRECVTNFPDGKNVFRLECACVFRQKAKRWERRKSNVTERILSFQWLLRMCAILSMLLPKKDKLHRSKWLHTMVAGKNYIYVNFDHVLIISHNIFTHLYRFYTTKITNHNNSGSLAALETAASNINNFKFESRKKISALALRSANRYHTDLVCTRTFVCPKQGFANQIGRKNHDIVGAKNTFYA